LDRELPALAKYLLDFAIPEHCKGSARYGVKSYHEPSLLLTAEQSSQTAVVHEVIDDWAKRYFVDSSEPFWEGTVYQLFKKLDESDSSASSALRFLNPDKLSRGLMSLKSKGLGFESRTERGLRQWRIERPPSLLSHRVTLGQNGPPDSKRTDYINGWDTGSLAVDSQPESDGNEPPIAGDNAAGDRTD
jgi:hypothetical protein